MTKDEYKQLQELFSKKLITFPNNKEERYNEGVRACKSILHSFYKSKQEEK